MVARHADQSVSDLAQREAVSRRACNIGPAIDGKRPAPQRDLPERLQLFISFWLERPIDKG